ncbi:MAG: PAS domain-containing protein [Nitrospinae bacterium]|nr:PAS domain-containing protein [Nitrospinota bacterium]
MREDDFIVSRTDTKGVITYGNKIFIELSEYSESELLGAPHNILRHPDMPRTVFKLLWDTVQSGNEIFAFVKNMSKSGAYYWVFANVTPDYNQQGQIIGYYSVRRKPNDSAVAVVSEVYRQMIEAERQGGMDASLKLLTELLESKGLSYDQLVQTLQKS